jgi:hypothetical protein
MNTALENTRDSAIKGNTVFSPAIGLIRLPCPSVMLTVAHERVDLETSKFVRILLMLS